MRPKGCSAVSSATAVEGPLLRFVCEAILSRRPCTPFLTGGTNDPDAPNHVRATSPVVLDQVLGARPFACAFVSVLLCRLSWSEDFHQNDSLAIIEHQFSKSFRCCLRKEFNVSSSTTTRSVTIGKGGRRLSTAVIPCLWAKRAGSPSRFSVCSTRCFIVAGMSKSSSVFRVSASRLT